MNIIVLVKQVPNTQEIKIDKEQGTLIRQGVESIVNPDDLAAVEVALELKDRYGACVHAMSMGPMSARNMFQELYAMGVDKCTLISDKAFAGSDTWATSTILKEAIKTVPYDLILAGRQAIDGDTAQVGPQVAEFLTLPQATYVTKIHGIEEGKITLSKITEDERLTLRIALPCVLTIMHEGVTPRLMDARYIFGSAQKEIGLLKFEDLKLNAAQCGIKGSPTRVKKTTTKTVMPKSNLKTLSAVETAQSIVQILKEKGVYVS